MKIFLSNLGCARNLVDSEVMMGKLKQSGYMLVDEPEDAQVIIVNTCSFIEAAANESIETILSLAEFKKKGSCDKLIVAGCLPERYRDQIIPAMPEVDVFLGTGAYGSILESVQERQHERVCRLPDPDTVQSESSDVPREITTGAFAYLKIAEGCSKSCTYCIIPRLRGKQKSRTPDDIDAEARKLIDSGVKEIVLVSQDTTAYGYDIDNAFDLSFLLEKLSRLDDNIWIRFLYGHPESITEKMIRTVADHPNICPYFDIPVQHAADRVLKRMGRRYTRKDLFRLFEKIRALIPHASLRTTVIAGFPGESKEDFEALMSFVKEIRFDHLGVFIYSDSEDIPSHRLRGHVPASIAKRRHNRLMAEQKKISEKNMRKHLGKTYKVLVESTHEKGVYLGRTCFQAPEVDGVTMINADHLSVSQMRQIKIVDTLEYDLVGVCHE